MDALCSYLPASILAYLLERGEGEILTPPLRQSYEASRTSKHTTRTGGERTQTMWVRMWVGG